MTLTKPLCLLLLLCLLLPYVASAECHEVASNDPSDLVMHIECTDGDTPQSYYIFSNSSFEIFKSPKYPQEYYNLKSEAAKRSVLNYDNGDIFQVVNPSWATDYRTAAILIALERQNELLAEQNALLRNMTTRCG